MQFMLPITMEQVVLVDPHIALTVDLAKGVKVELPHQGLEPVVPKVLRQGFRLETLQIGTNDEGITRWSPLSIDCPTQQQRTTRCERLTPIRERGD
jgi:hypothetical protein